MSYWRSCSYLHCVSWRHRETNFPVLLILSVLALLFIWVRLTMRHFAIEWWKSALFILIFTLVSSGLFSALKSHLPLPEYQNTKAELEIIPAFILLPLLLQEEKEQMELLAALKDRFTIQHWDRDSEKEWLQVWKDQMETEKKLIDPADAVVVKYYNMRTALFNEHTRRYRSAPEKHPTAPSE